MSFLKAVRTKMGLENQELEEFKKRIKNVPSLAECLDAERGISRPAAAASYTLLPNEDQCSREVLHRVIIDLREKGDEPTLELFKYYLSLRENHETILKLEIQIEGSPKKEFYGKICSILEELIQDTLRVQDFQVDQLQEAYLNKKKTLGEDNPDTIDSLQVDQLQEAYLNKNKTLGEDNPDTIDSLNDLANLFYTRGEYDNALPLYKLCLEKRRRVLGDDHPHTLQSLNNLAEVFKIMGDYKSALPLYKLCLEKRRRVLGDDHPHTLQSLNNLAEVFKIMGDYKSALPLYKECMFRSLSADDFESFRSRALGNLSENTSNPYLEDVNCCERKIVEEQGQKDRLGGRNKSKRNNKNKNKYFRSTRRRRYSRARGGKKFATSSSKTIKRRRKNVR